MEPILITSEQDLFQKVYNHYKSYPDHLKAILFILNTKKQSLSNTGDKIDHAILDLALLGICTIIERIKKQEESLEESSPN